jgi:hypothetical protein
MTTIQYNWKDSGWKDLREYSIHLVDYELQKMINLYSHEYKFRLA